MRRRYVAFNGPSFEGEGYAGVVRDMRDAAWMVAPKKLYMREVAARVLDLTGNVIRWRAGAQAFLEDLMETGYLKEGGTYVS